MPDKMRLRPMMKRLAESYLIDWKERRNRKPLILRGARQTGKTYLVEKFARSHFDIVLKVDFEFDLAVKSIFQSRNPHTITSELSLYFDTEITANQTLLFLDEIQACPEAIATLRYFYEKMPELHVIAAGSLLDFTLREFAYSMPVGRIEFLYLNPMTFAEFLLSVNAGLYEYISKWTIHEEIGDAVHQKLTNILRTYFFVGGMPEAVATYIEEKHFLAVKRVQNSILTTMQNDFAKYASRIKQTTLTKVMQYVPRAIGKKVKYVNIDRSLRSAVLKEAFELLAMSKIVHLVQKSSGNGVPLDAEVFPHVFKPLFLDIGLANHICGLNLIEPEELITVYEGGLAEQFIGQELLNLGYPFEESRLYYWSREEKNANAEIDYLLSYQNTVIPLEVKAGKTGSLKSLHLFLYDKGLHQGLRYNMDQPSIGRFKAKVRIKKKEGAFAFTLLSLPLYLAGHMDRLMELFFKENL